MIVHSSMTNRFQFSTNFIIFSFSLLVHSVWLIEGKEKSIEKMVEDSKKKHVTSLSCHVCHSEMNDTCFNFTESGEGFPGHPRSCESDQLMCVVKKFAFTSTDEDGNTTPIKTFSIKRNCTNRCENGCVVMGERTRLYVCSQCCSTPLCNVGSGSGSVHYYIENSLQYYVPSVGFAGILRYMLPVVESYFSILSIRFLQLLV